MGGGDPHARSLPPPRWITIMIRNPDTLSQWPRGPVDKASAQGAGQCRFESYCFALASTQVGYFWIRNPVACAQWPRGPMDKALAYGAGDCRFESCRGHAHIAVCMCIACTYEICMM